MKTGWLFWLAPLVLAAAGTAAWMHQPEKQAAPLRFLALGDSYTVGESVPTRGSWPHQLRDSLVAHGVQVQPPQVIARTGWRTTQLQAAIAQAKPAHDHDLVSLLIGVNDYFQGQPIPAILPHFRELVHTAIAHAGGHPERVFVLSIPDYTYGPAYKDYHNPVSADLDALNMQCAAIAKAEGVAYYDITGISRLGLQYPEWVAYDGLHPSAAQYTAWVERILPKVLAQLQQAQ